MTPLEIVAETEAPVPLKETCGAEVYPFPGLPMTIPVNIPFSFTTEVADAPVVAPPPLNTTSGGEV